MLSIARSIGSRNSMRRQAVGSVACGVVIAVAMKAGWVQAVPHFASLNQPAATNAGALLQVADMGVDIIRMPPGSLPTPGPQPSYVAPQPRPDPARRAQPQGRVLSVPVKIGSLAPETNKAWLGVSTDALDLPLALSLGRTSASGALVLEATAGSPAAEAGLRFGDIIVGFNDKPVSQMDELRQYVAASTPGAQAMLEVWRIASDDGDFLYTLRRLAGGGNAHVMYRLGRLYSVGTGVARDENEAASWFRKGSDAGNLHAMSAFAVALLEGRGVAKDQVEAVRLLKLAADKDGVDATYRLGVLMVQGKGVEKDVLEGMRLLTKASDAGSTAAMVDLGVMYNNGIGIQIDFARAASWFKRAADLGNASGMVSLGYLYQQGKGVEQSDYAAATLYRKATDLGSPYGIHNLAAMLDKGKGVQRDPEQAADLVLQAIELGNQFSYQQMTRNSHAWTSDFRRALQRKLRDAGTFTGRIDGAIRSSTITALNDYINRSRRRVDPQMANGGSGRSL